MAAVSVTSDLPPQAELQNHLHPLAPLTAAEITATRDAIQATYPRGVNLLFKQITLREPAKAELAPYLDAEAERTRLHSIDRRSFITYYIRNTVCGTLLFLSREL